MSTSSKISNREEQRQKIKNKIHNRDLDDLIYIPARKEISDYDEPKQLRVCAYCRVSTDDPAQTTSYELQKEHYEEEINKRDNWIFSGIYADEGISATSLKHRDSFNRMIADCKAGKIDLIVTKAVSRFARNVVDCLSVVRMLLQQNPPVGVYFETENINTLDSTSEMILTFISAFAQEESKTKSNSMMWSVANRFKRGQFLTPVLLGYDHDEDGNLIINEDEANTVRLMYYMYLTGFSLKEIAELLMELERETKLGKTKWCSSTVRSILENERYCGDVISWKTYTWDFYEHKKRKNKNGERPQTKKINHHDSIVSHEVYNATQLKLSAEKNIRGGIPLPSLEVITSGMLKGYVSVNRLWRGFSGDDYEEASKSVYSEKVQQNDISEQFELDGFQIVRSHFFNTQEKPLLSIGKGKVRFNATCLKKFDGVEHVELLFNSVQKCMAIRPCTEDNPNAIKWANLYKSRWRVAPKSCSGFVGPLYSIMDWEADCGYKLCGQYFEDGDNKVIVFDLSDPEICQYELVENEQDQDDDKTQRRKSSYISRQIIPEHWKTGFGKPATKENIFVFTSKPDKDGWEIMAPTTVFRMSGDMEKNTLSILKNEATKILDHIRNKEEGDGYEYVY